MIGIIDSGVGGLSVVRELLKADSKASFIYLGDNKNVPYGIKTKEEITQLTFNMIDYLVKHYSVTTLVIACNTIVAACFDEIQMRYPDMKIENIIAHGATGALLSLSDNVTVIATDMTCKSGVYSKYIQNISEDTQVQMLPASTWVQMVEKNDINHNELERILQKIQKQTDVLILGCTHFPFLYEEIRKRVHHDIQIVDPAYSCIQMLAKVGEKNRTYLTTGNAEQFYDFIIREQIDEIPNVQKVLIEEGEER